MRLLTTIEKSPFDPSAHDSEEDPDDEDLEDDEELRGILLLL